MTISTNVKFRHNDGYIISYDSNEIITDLYSH
jgi:hypothetical protein